MDAILKAQADKLAREMAAQVTTLDDLNGLMRSMMKTALERMLNTELDVHLGRREPLEATDVAIATAELPASAAPDILARPSVATWATSRSRRRATATAASSPG